MLKYENVAKVGDLIRAYDFKPMAGRDDVYVEGVVIGINDNDGYKAFVIVCTKDSSPADRYAEIVYVPMEVSIMEFDGRVVNLLEKELA